MLPYISFEPIEIAGTVVRVFDLLVVFAIIFGVMLCEHRSKRLGLDRRVVTDVAFWAILPGLVGSHLYALVFYYWERVVADPWVLLYIWNGMSSFGGFLGGSAGVIAYFKIKKLPFWPYSDPLVYGFTFAWIFGRLGCSIAHDHPGLPAKAFTLLAVNYPARGGFPAGPRHDLGVYELLWALAMAGTFYLLRRRPKVSGWHLSVFMLTYMPVRFLFDFLRTSDTLFAGLTAAQYTAIVVFGVGVWMWRARHAQPERLVEDGEVHVFPDGTLALPVDSVGADEDPGSEGGDAHVQGPAG